MSENRNRKVKHIIAKIICVIGYLVVGATYGSILASLVFWILADPLKTLLIIIGYIVIIILIFLTYYGFVTLLNWLEK